MTVDEKENVHKNLLSYTKKHDLDIPPPLDDIYVYRDQCYKTFCRNWTAVKLQQNFDALF